MSNNPTWNHDKTGAKGKVIRDSSLGFSLAPRSCKAQSASVLHYFGLSNYCSAYQHQYNTEITHKVLLVAQCYDVLSSKDYLNGKVQSHSKLPAKFRALQMLHAEPDSFKVAVSVTNAVRNRTVRTVQNACVWWVAQSARLFT